MFDDDIPGQCEEEFGPDVERWCGPCPATSDRRPCSQPYDIGKNCQVFTCSDCSRVVPWCFGACDSERCDDCELKTGAL